MKEKGVVISQEVNMAKIAVVRVSACGSNCKSCGGGCDSSSVVVNAVTDLKLRPGDVVDIESSTSNMMASVFVAYVIPLIFLMVGSVGGTELFKNMGYSNYEAFGFGLGILLLALSFFAVRFFGNKVAKEQFRVVSLEKSIMDRR